MECHFSIGNGYFSDMEPDCANTIETLTSWEPFEDLAGLTIITWRVLIKKFRELSVLIVASTLT